MSASPVILCAGRLYCDLVFTDLPRVPSMGTEVYAGAFGVHAGGGAFITAAHLGALGRRAALAAMIPSAPFRDVIVEELLAAGVDFGLCEGAAPEHDAQVTAVMATNGDRAFLTRRTGPAFPKLAPADLTAMGVTHVHIAELATLVERPDLIPLARDAGATLSLDCGWDEGLCAEQIADLIAAVDLFLPNDAEAKRLGEMGLPEQMAPVVAIKRGRNGASVISADGSLDQPTRPAPVVDATGAGDAFNAGFLDAWLGGADLGSCLSAGNAQGAKALGRPGGFHPRTDQLPGIAS